MSATLARTGWVLAAIFGTLALTFAMKYDAARQQDKARRVEFDALKRRVEQQAGQNSELGASLRALSEQLNAAQSRLEALSHATPAPPTPAP